MTSGTADESVTDHLIEGTSAFLAKPFRPSEFIDRVHELLARERDV
jgi:DNA-binding response OmpR family regulator